MNSLWQQSLDYAKNQKMKKLESVFSSLKQEQVGSLIECPFCHYIGKNKRGTAKIFDDGSSKSIKCFACGIWRKL